MSAVVVPQKRSLLADPRFFPLAVLTCGLGHVFDLIGTYIHQPHFEHEANPLHNFLLARGIYLGWPGAIIGKTVFWLLCAWALRRFLETRRRYYPEPGASVREFVTFTLYGRYLSWLETFYRLPRKSHLPLYLLSIGAALCLSGPMFAYFGYDNLAHEYGWPCLGGGLYLGGIWVNYVMLAWVCLAFAWLCWLIWDDYRTSTDTPAAAFNASSCLPPASTASPHR